LIADGTCINNWQIRGERIIEEDFGRNMVNGIRRCPAVYAYALEPLIHK
jgi:hypothetical protein